MRAVRAMSWPLALLALVVLTYFPIWNNDFVDFDDPDYIIANPCVSGGFSWPNFCWVWTIDKATYWLPLTWLSLQLDAHCFAVRTPEGDSIVPPAAVHGQNLFWHAANVLLLFGFWLRLTGRRGPSFLVAALFAVHPMHVESVAWAVERKDVLSGFFGLLALWAYVYYLDKPSWLRYLPLAAAYSLSLLAKPMLLTLPFVLLLLDFWPLRRLRGDTLGRLILEKMPLFLLAGVVAAVTLEFQASRGSMVSLDRIPFSARLANAMTAYGWYLRSTFYPVGLAILYPHPREHWTLLPAVAGAVTVLSLTLLCWWQARRRPWLLVGWLWFVGTLLPVIGLAQGGRQAWADRFSYWPHIGLFVAIVWGLAELGERLRLPFLVLRLAGAIVLGWLAMLTWDQVHYWRDTPTVWERAVNVTKDNSDAHEHLATYYYNRGQREEMESHLAEAVRIQRRRLQGFWP